MMKRRRDGGESGTGSAPFKMQEKQQQSKNRRRLGGGGLSLNAFAAAKSKPLISPAQIRKQREFHQNAKKVQKYKKLVKQLGGQGLSVVSKIEREVDKPIEEQHSKVVIDDTAPKKGIVGFRGKKFPHLRTDGKQFKAHENQTRQQKSTSQMEKIREEYEEQKLDKEKQRKEREDLYAEQLQSKEKAQHARKKLQVKLRKKTSRGQPVMKHRMETLLEAIQQGS